MIESIVATSAGLASDFNIGCSVLGLRCFALCLNRLQNLARRVVPGDATNGAAAERARPAEEDVLVFGFDPPGPCLSFRGCEWPRRCVVKTVSMKHSSRVFDINRAF